MAGPLGSSRATHGESDTGSTLLDHYLRNHNIAHSPLYTVLDKSHLHHERHDLVSSKLQLAETKLTSPRLLIALAFASTVSWIVRYRFLNMYTRLPPEPQRKEPQIDLFPDTQEGDSKHGLANYLDEFLSAIKVFGYRTYVRRQTFSWKRINSLKSRTICLSRAHTDYANPEIDCRRNAYARGREGFLLGG